MEQQLRSKTQSSDRLWHRWQGFNPLHLILRRLHSLHATIVYPRRFARMLVDLSPSSSLLFPSRRADWGDTLSGLLLILISSTAIRARSAWFVWGSQDLERSPRTTDERRSKGQCFSRGLPVARGEERKVQVVSPKVAFAGITSKLTLEGAHCLLQGHL